MEENQSTVQEEAALALPPKITKENIDPLKYSRKGIVFSWIRSVVYTTVSALLIAVAAYSLIAPNNFTIGGASGLAILFNIAFGVPQWCILMAFNAPLLLVSYFFVKRRFAILSSLNIGLQTLFLLLLEELFPSFLIDFSAEISVGAGGEGAKIFAALSAGLCIGVAIALAFKAGGSTGGSDILAVMIQKKFATASIAWLIFAINFVIIAASLLVFRVKGNLALTLLPVMLAIFEAYIESRTNESVSNGFQSAVEFRIITNKPELMSTVLMKELSRGVTAVSVTGMYTKEERSMLICVVSRRQITTVRRIMKSVDPDSFATVSKVSQVLGLGFHASEH